MDAQGSWSGGCQVRPAGRALSHPADFKPGLQNPNLTLNFAGAFSVDNMNQAQPAWNFKVPEFGGLHTKRCVLRDAGLLCAEKDWHKTRATNNWAMGMAVPVSPNMQSQHNRCALPASCCHHLQLWVLHAWFGFSEVLSKRYHVYVEAGEKSSKGCLCLKVWCVLKLLPLFQRLWKGALRQWRPALGELAAFSCAWHQLLPGAKHSGLDPEAPN